MWFWYISLQRESRMGWKDGSFQIIAGMLSRPGDLLTFIVLIAARSSSMVNGSVLISRGSDMGSNGRVEPLIGVGGGWPRSFLKWPTQFSSRFGEEPPLIVMEDLLFRPVSWFMVFQAAVCFFSLWSFLLVVLCNLLRAYLNHCLAKYFIMKWKK